MNSRTITYWLLLVFLPLLFGVSIYQFEFLQHKLIRNYVPDFFWAFSCTSALLFLAWFFEFPKYIIAVLALLICLSHELAQATGVTIGTFDWYDIVVISAASIFASSIQFLCFSQVLKR